MGDRQEHLVEGNVYTVGYVADISEVCLTGRLELLLTEGDVDPFTGEQIGAFHAWRTYWSNGVVLDTMGEPWVLEVHDG